jgi:transaldolase
MAKYASIHPARVLRQVDMTAGAFETFKKMHGEDQMAVDKLREGIESFAKDQSKVEALVHELIPQVMAK